MNLHLREFAGLSMNLERSFLKTGDGFQRFSYFPPQKCDFFLLSNIEQSVQYNIKLIGIFFGTTSLRMCWRRGLIFRAVGLLMVFILFYVKSMITEALSLVQCIRIAKFVNEPKQRFHILEWSSSFDTCSVSVSEKFGLSVKL